MTYRPTTWLLPFLSALFWYSCTDSGWWLNDHRFTQGEISPLPPGSKTESAYGTGHPQASTTRARSRASCSNLESTPGA